MATPTDEVILCHFPKEGTVARIPITLEDYKTLKDGTFLNDIIIDFYLLLLKNNLGEESVNVHLFSAMFFKSLREPRQYVSEVNAFEKDLSLTSAEKRFFRVERWTKNVNLFEKKLLVIPCCENKHWFLVLAFMPGFVKVSLR